MRSINCKHFYRQDCEKKPRMFGLWLGSCTLLVEGRICIDEEPRKRPQPPNTKYEMSQAKCLETIRRMASTGFSIEDLPVTSWSGGYFSSQDTQLPNYRVKRLTKQTAKEVATKFFYHWHNSSGTNTEQGFDDWWELHWQEFLEEVKEDG